MMKLRLFLSLLLLGLSSGVSYGSYQELIQRVDNFVDSHDSKTRVADKTYTTILNDIANLRSGEDDQLAYLELTRKARAIQAMGNCLWDYGHLYPQCPGPIIVCIETIIENHSLDLNEDTLRSVNAVSALIDTVEKGLLHEFPPDDQRIPVRLRTVKRRLLETVAGQKYQEKIDEEKRVAEEKEKAAASAESARKAIEKAEKRRAKEAAKKSEQQSSTTHGDANASLTGQQKQQQLVEKAAEKPARFTLASKFMLFSAIASTVTCIALFAFQNRHDLLSGKFNVKSFWPMKRGVKTIRF